MKKNKEPKAPSVAQQLEAVKLKKELLELKLMEAQVAALEAGEQAVRMTTEQQERINKQEAANKAKLIADCAHRKGGMDKEGFKNGDRSERSVIRHTYPLPFMPDFPECTGTHIMCTRCPLDINQGDALFAEAMRWQTNNKPSGNNLYTVTYNDPRAAA